LEKINKEKHVEMSNLEKECPVDFLQSINGLDNYVSQPIYFPRSSAHL